jgi:predicted 2-oxoglutarate/Fe(II)-dependent dioxygenase YbiX
MANLINGFFPGELAPSTTVAGCIDIYENAWPKPHETIAMVENRISDPNSDARWEKATTLGLGQNQDIRTNKHLSLTHYGRINNDPVFQNIHNQFNVLLLASTIPYNERYKINEPFWHEDYNLLKYNNNQLYHRHYDGVTASGRVLSAICYLNDDYEGGELEFPNFGITIKPQAGMLILFPSNYAYAHIARPVTTGTKYAIVTWIRDREMGRA